MRFQRRETGSGRLFIHPAFLENTHTHTQRRSLWVALCGPQRHWELPAWESQSAGTLARADSCSCCTRAPKRQVARKAHHGERAPTVQSRAARPCTRWQVALSSAAARATRRFTALLTALLSAAVFLAAPATEAPKRRPAEVHRLKNGMRVVFIPFESPGLVAYYTLMRVGSRNEPEPGRSGYAHFFEHMMFRGTPTNPADKYNADVVSLGLDTNAFTSEDMTIYHLFGPSKALPTIIDLEADRFQNLSYSEAQFRTEAGAILGEYAKSASNPLQLMQEKVLETAFTNHTYRHTVIGYLADVKAMPAGFDYSREFFRRYYTPDNATVFVVGDFDHAATLTHMEKAYGGWKGKVQPATIPAEPVQRVARRASVPWNSPTLPRLWMNWHTPSAANVRATAIQLVLNEYLFGTTSPLVQDLVRTRQIADAVDASYSPQRDPGLFGVLLRMKSDKDLALGEQAVLATIQGLAEGKVDAPRVASVRSNVKYQRLMTQDRANRVAVEAAVTTALTGDVAYNDKLLATIGTVTPKELSVFARKYLIASNSTTVTLQTTPSASGGTN